MSDDFRDMDFKGIRLIEKLGEGGMSSVWKAEDFTRNETVAVKILKKEFSVNRSDIEQFKAEQNAMQTISHAGIVKSYELRHANGYWYYAMEYVDGYNFKALLDKKTRLHEIDCLLISQSVSAALDYAWNDHGVVHCDIKPENIMVNSDGIVKLTDLGLCYTYRFLKDGQKDKPQDYVMGTPGYISPEQIYGDIELDCRADIYSLGASLYHLATGRMLFPGLSSDDTMLAHCSDECQADNPRMHNPNISEGFCQMLEAMLVKERNGRTPRWSDVYEMSIQVEQGMKFKPRFGILPSSIKLLKD